MTTHNPPVYNEQYGGGQEYPPVIQQPQFGEGGLGGQPPPPGCPPGLQYLTMVDQLIVKQQMEVLELVTGG